MGCVHSPVITSSFPRSPPRAPLFCRGYVYPVCFTVMENPCDTYKQWKLNTGWIELKTDRKKYFLFIIIHSNLHFTQIQIISIVYCLLQRNKTKITEHVARRVYSVSRIIWLWGYLLSHIHLAVQISSGYTKYAPLVHLYHQHMCTITTLVIFTEYYNM
jgi:hypothetical protein